MSFYINPSLMTKERFLDIYGHHITKEQFLDPSFNPEAVKVCLVDNGPFTAAAIGYSIEECREFCRPSDLRPKLFYAVLPAHLKEHDCVHQDYFDEYWPDL